MAGHTVIVSVLADTKKFSRAFNNLSKEMGLNKLASGFKSVGSRIGGMVTTAVKGTAAIAAGIAAIAVKGGFERAMKIEDAQAKLKGLGHDAKNVDQIMADALASVKGTAYGLDTAATTAATAVAAGIKPGQQLEKYLKLTADAATIAGVSMDEMGSIMNKVAAKGKVSAREINQFTERGIPILQMLADEYQVTAEEMSKMVSSGEVDAERFRKALEEGVGGAALESGNTTRGAFANMKAALSRTGLALIEDVFPMFKDLFTGITSGLDNLTEAVKPVGQAFSKWIENTALPIIKRFGGWLRDDLWPGIKNVAGLLSGAFATAWNTVKTALADAGIAAGDVGGSIGDTLLTVLEKAAAAVAWVVEKLGTFSAWVIEHRETIKAVAVGLGAAVAAFAALNKVLAIARAVTVAFNVVMAANPISLIVIAVAALVGALIWFFTQTELGQKIVETVWGAIQTAIAAVVDWWNDTLMPAIETVTEFIGEAWEGASAWFAEHVVPIFESGGELLSAVWERIKQGVALMWEVIGPYFDLVASTWQTVWDAIKSIWEGIGPPILEAIETGFEILSRVLSIIWDHIKSVVETALNIIKGVIDVVTKVIQGDWEGAWEAVKGIMSDTWDSIMGWFEDIPGRIAGVFADAGQWLWDAGKNIINGLWDGLKGAWENVKGWFSGLGGWIADNKGPKAYDLALLVPAGKWIMQGLQTGLRKEIPNLKKTLGGVADTVVDTKFEPLQASLDARQQHVQATAQTAVTAKPVQATFTDEQISVLRDVFRTAIFEATSGGIRDGFSGVSSAARLSSVVV